MIKRDLCFFLALLVCPLIVGCPPIDDDDPIVPVTDYRQAMRELVQDISAYAKNADPSFLVVPQNGEALLTQDGTCTGAPNIAYASSIDGLGREDLFYGYLQDDCATPSDCRDPMLGLLDLAEDQGIQALVIDYCTTHSRVDTSYSWSESRGYASIATTRALNAVPAYPSKPYMANNNDVASLAAAQNFLYLLDTAMFGTAESYAWALDSTDYDVLVIEPFFDDQLLTLEQVDALKTKAQGGKRLVLAYMSIGEAEDYRYYWQSTWGLRPPEWIAEENPDWPGNYVVRYWAPAWQDILYGSQNAYLDRLLAAGFDGVYLDGVDVYEYFED